MQRTLLMGVYYSIIFVHGLGSNPDTTWKLKNTAANSEMINDEEYVCWVTDFLPHDIPPAVLQDLRVFFYNHDSFWQRDSVQTRLWNLGHNLLNQMSMGIRRTEEVSKTAVLILVNQLTDNLL